MFHFNQSIFRFRRVALKTSPSPAEHEPVSQFPHLVRVSERHLRLFGSVAHHDQSTERPDEPADADVTDHVELPVLRTVQRVQQLLADAVQ